MIVGFSYHPPSKRIFITLPRIRDGIPATLAVIDVDSFKTNQSPILLPFPSYKVNELKECDFDEDSSRTGAHGSSIDGAFDPFFDSRSIKRKSSPKRGKVSKQPQTSTKETKLVSSSNCDSANRILSVYKVTTDKCNRLWFMDTGTLEYSTGVVHVKDPQLWVIDISTPKFRVLRRFDFSKRFFKTPEGVTGPAVDIVQNDCENTFAYLSNIFDNRMVVYDYKNHKAWSFDDDSFKGDSQESDYVYGGFPSTFKTGLFSITLTKANREGFRTAFYIPGASTAQYAVSTYELRNRKQSPKLRHPQLVGHRGCNSQSVNHVIDKRNGIMFWAEAQSTKVRCWNMDLPLKPENIGVVFQSDEFISGSVSEVRYPNFFQLDILISF